jgi:hypothetical protein
LFGHINFIFQYTFWKWRLLQLNEHKCNIYYNFVAFMTFFHMFTYSRVPSSSSMLNAAILVMLRTEDLKTNVDSCNVKIWSNRVSLCFYSLWNKVYLKKNKHIKIDLFKVCYGLNHIPSSNWPAVVSYISAWSGTGKSDLELAHAWPRLWKMQKSVMFPTIIRLIDEYLIWNNFRSSHTMIEA